VATSKVTQATFARLLEQLDVDVERAGAKYEELRQVLIRFFEWRGAPYPEEHADATFDRVARKLGEGVVVTNIGGYCYEVARLICLEALKAPDRRRVAIDAEPAGLTVPHPSDTGEADAERRMRCLQQCLADLSEDNRRLILAYYGDFGGRRADHRRDMAARLGVDRDALANRAQRIRNKLEACVERCLNTAGDMNRSIDTLINRPNAGRKPR